MLIALLAVVAMVASTIGLSVGMAAPASAAVSNPHINAPTWEVGTTNAVTLDWTETTAGTSTVMFRSPWPWTSTWLTTDTFAATDGTTSGTNAAQTIKCTKTGVSIIFTISSASLTSQPNCEYRNSNGVDGFTGVWITGGSLNVAINATISVSIPSGQVFAPASPRTDTWIVGQYGSLWSSSTQAEVTTAAVASGGGGGTAVPTITIDFDGNGGTCATQKVTGLEGSWANAPTDSVCTRDGYLLGSFNTSANGSGLSIPVGGNLNLTGDNRIYAQWLSAEAPILTPGVPTDVVATSLWNRVQVNWTAPTDQGTTPVVNYLVNAHPGANICITSVVKDKKPTQCSFNGQLTAGTKYTFTVSALNYGGWGDASSASAPASPQSLGITSYKRSKVFLSLDSKVDVGGIAPGYAAGTKATPWAKVGDAGTWVAQKGALATVNASGKFGWSARFKKNAKNESIYVKFTVDGTNFTNIVQIRPSGSSSVVKQIYIVRKNREIAPSGRQYLVATAQTHGFKKGDQLAVWLKWGSGTIAKSPGALKVAADGTVGLRMPVATRNRSESVTFYIASQDDQVKSNVATERVP